MANKTSFPVLGSVNGAAHAFASAMFSGGRSLHPLQRAGVIPHLGFSNVGVAALPGAGSAPPAGGPALAYPDSLITSASHVLGANVRVS